MKSTLHPTVVITGANRGIGFELARQLVASGRQVVVGIRKVNQSTELKALTAEHPSHVYVIDLDVTSDASVAAFAVELKKLTELKISALINNAGIYDAHDGAASAVPANRIMQSIDTNAIGAVRVTQAILPFLKTGSAQPKVLNITSRMGSIADNTSGGSLAYRMSKAAMNMFTKTLALDEKTVTVLSVHPGWVQTRMGGKEAPLAAEASAKSILQLLDEAVPASSGQFFNYTGQELPW